VRGRTRLTRDVICMKTIVAFLLAIAATVTMAAERSAPDFAVTLSIVQPRIRVGEMPQFLMKVQALAPLVRIMKLGERSDLRHNYAPITIKRDGKTIDTPMMISDPGPISDEDYLELKKGEELVFKHDGRPLSLTELAPGTYAAKVSVWPDWNSEPVSSNFIYFQVLQ
jgi:hypothetical protein